MKGKFFFAGLMILLSVSLFSCGGGSGGGAAVYDTVTLTAEAVVSSPFDSVVAIHTADPGGEHCGDSSLDSTTGTPFDTVSSLPDDINVTITSTAFPGLPASTVPSEVRISGVTLKYTSATNPASPSIPDQHYALSTIIPAGGTATVSVRLASQAMKVSPPLSDLVCGGGGIYSYYVTLTFTGIEVISEKEKRFETNLSVNFADFSD